MLVIVSEDYFGRVVDFAKRTGRQAQLQQQLDYLATYACHDEGGDKEKTRCKLVVDFAPASFNFVMERRKTPDSPYEFWFNGGLVFHGNHDGFGSGSAPTFSVCLEPTDGWEVHT